MDQYNDYFENLEKRYYSLLLNDFDKVISNARDEEFAIILYQLGIAYPRRFYKFQPEYEKELISGFKYFYKLNKKNAISDVLEAIPELRKRHLIRRKEEALKQLKEDKINWKIYNFPEKTINDDGTGYIQPMIEQVGNGKTRTSEDFLNITNPKKILKYIIRWHVKENFLFFINGEVDKLGLTEEKKAQIIDRLLPSDQLFGYSKEKAKELTEEMELEDNQSTTNEQPTLSEVNLNINDSSNSQLVLIFYYFFKQNGLEPRKIVDVAPIAKFLHLITGKELKRITNSDFYKKMLKAPNFKTNKELINDLNKIRPFFQKVGLKEVVELIDVEIEVARNEIKNSQ